MRRSGVIPTRADGFKLPSLTGDIQIDYAGLSFVAPDKMRFRYKLDGFDKSWTDAGLRRQAFYTTRLPGNYRFHVIASNNNGVPPSSRL